jgi:hypothetical protein
VVVNRTAIIASLAAVAVAGGVTFAAARPSDEPSLLRTTSETYDTTTSTSEPESTTITTGTIPAPDGTVISWRTTTTSEAPPVTTIPPETTTSTATPEERVLQLRCSGSGDPDKTGTKPGDRTSDEAWVYCEFHDVDERATQITLSRDEEVIARTGDTSVTSYKDREVRPGTTYSYQVHTYAADGALLQVSEAVRATTAGEAPHDGPLVLRCAGSGTKVSQKPGTTTPIVYCEWKGVPEHAAYVKLVRDGTPINRSDEPYGGSYEDHEVWPDDTYTYQVQAYAADDTVVASSESVTASPGGGGEGS